MPSKITLTTEGHRKDTQSMGNRLLNNVEHSRSGGDSIIHNPLTPHHEEVDDYDDLMMPTDDEGPTNYNSTQKIPISLIKK